jgi:hypothetical protein
MNRAKKIELVRMWRPGLSMYRENQLIYSLVRREDIGGLSLNVDHQGSKKGRTLWGKGVGGIM